MYSQVLYELCSQAHFTWSVRFGSFCSLFSFFVLFCVFIFVSLRTNGKEGRKIPWPHVFYLLHFLRNRQPAHFARKHRESERNDGGKIQRRSYQEKCPLKSATQISFDLFYEVLCDSIFFIYVSLGVWKNWRIYFMGDVRHNKMDLQYIMRCIIDAKYCRQKEKKSKSM